MYEFKAHIMERVDHNFSPQNMRGYRLTIFAQLRQAIESMHRPEEMFQWLAYMIVQRFDVPIIQFWTCNNSLPDQPSAQLRAMASQDASRPAYLVSEKVALTVEQISRAQPIRSAQSVEQIFPYYLASLLKRYGLGYCASCLINRHARFAAEASTPSQATASTGLTFIGLLYLRHPPHQDLISTIGIIMEQAITVAESHGLLLPPVASSGRVSLPQQALSQGPTSALDDLIPRLKQDTGLMLSSNPFASRVTISNEQARRLQDAIDGRKTVAELCTSTGMTMQEVHAALQTLLTLKAIEIYTPSGQPADLALLFQKR